ncbi:unnamed protein product [Closterium sp. NIES-65]|nr:unnamed protein product [Closterium sp. NIES-65]
MSAPLLAEAEPPLERALDRAPVYLKDMSFQQLEDWVAAECGEEHRRRAKVLWKWLYRDAHWAESVDDMAVALSSLTSPLPSQRSLRRLIGSFAFPLSSLTHFPEFPNSHVRAAGVSRSFLSLLASSGARFSSLRLHSVRTAADGTKKVSGVRETPQEHSPQLIFAPAAASPPFACTPFESQPTAQRKMGLQRNLTAGEIVAWIRMGLQRNLTAGEIVAWIRMGLQRNLTAGEIVAWIRMGLQRNLTAGEIVDQVVEIRRLFTEEIGPVTNLVFMGMGEPLHNLPAVLTACNTLLDPLGAHCSPARTTVSTCGLVPEMHEFCSHSDASLALSLHATTDEVRSSIMPINKKHNLSALFACLIQLFPDPTARPAPDAGEGGDGRDGAGLQQQSKKRHVFIEYLMLDGVNDSLEDARRLVTLTAGIACKINLIVFNPHPGTALQPSPLPRVLAFQHELVQGGRKAYLRHSRGDDEMAACGQLGQVPRLTGQNKAEAEAVV